MKKYLSMFLIVSLLLTNASFVMAESGPYTLLQPGDSGEEVMALQKKLYELGYTMTESDGTYGAGTEDAVRSFQSMNGLLVTGIADQTTQAVLFSSRAVPYDEYDDHVIEVEEAAEGYAALGMNVFAAMATSMPAAAKNSSAFYMPDFNRDSYALIRENGFQSVSASPFSTFSADVDTSSYAQVRSRILRGENVPADSDGGF